MKRWKFKHPLEKWPSYSQLGKIHFECAKEFARRGEADWHETLCKKKIHGGALQRTRSRVYRANIPLHTVSKGGDIYVVRTRVPPDCGGRHNRAAGDPRSGSSCALLITNDGVPQSNRATRALRRSLTHSKDRARNAYYIQTHCYSREYARTCGCMAASRSFPRPRGRFLATIRKSKLKCQ